MSRLVRGIAWRSGPSIALVAMAATVVGGATAAAAVSERADVTPGSIGVLVLLGVVVVSVQSASTARSRQPELALAQLRGRQGTRLLASFLAEPVSLLLVGAGLGLAIGWATTGITDLGWTMAGVSVGACLVAVVVGSWRAVRRPLFDQLDQSHRPRSPAVLMLLGQTIVVVGAALGGYQALQDTQSREGLASLLSPALLSPLLFGLAAGLAGVWLARLAARARVRRTREAGSMAAFLASRRVSRRGDAPLGAWLVIAAGVVVAVSVSATASVFGWQDQQVRLDLGGPVQFAVADGPDAAQRAAEAADPDGDWLMAIVGIPDESDAYRRVFVDATRWQTVVGDFYSATPAAGVSGHAADVAAGREGGGGGKWPAIMTSGYDPVREAGGAIGYGLDGTSIDVDKVGTAEALPIVGGQGMLLDLGQGLLGSRRAIPGAEAYVVARDDTPDSVMEALEDTGAVGAPLTLDEATSAARGGDDIEAVRLYLLIAAVAVLLALISSAAAAMGQRPDRRRELAGLRVTGVRQRDLRRSVRLEALWLGVVTVVAVGVAGWVGARLIVDGLDLVPQTAYATPLDPAPSIVLIVLAAFAAGAASTLVTALVNRGVVDRALPRVLREEGT